MAAAAGETGSGGGSTSGSAGLGGAVEGPSDGGGVAEDRLPKDVEPSVDVADSWRGRSGGRSQQSVRGSGACRMKPVCQVLHATMEGPSSLSSSSRNPSMNVFFTFTGWLSSSPMKESFLVKALPCSPSPSSSTYDDPCSGTSTCWGATLYRPAVGVGVAGHRKAGVQLPRPSRLDDGLKNKAGIALSTNNEELGKLGNDNLQGAAGS